MKNANDGIHEILKDAVWEYEGSLPAWTSRHGIITGDSFEYGNKHLFTGYARVLNREYDKRIKTLWNDQLMPWPWFLSITHFPEDKESLVGLEDKPELQSKHIWLVYADGKGMWSARYPIKLMNTLADKFNEITEKYLPEPKAPDITYPHGDLTKKDVEFLINENYGQLLTPILGKVKS